jgi:hypothetical protein
MKRLTHFPTIRLSELVKEFGGVARDDGIENAKGELEGLRDQADQVINDSIAALEAVVAQPHGTAYSQDQAYQILVRGDQIVTLAGAFGYKGLDEAARCLCDLVDNRAQAGASETASVEVHIRTLRLLAPSSPQLAPEHQDRLTAELARILTHHGITRAGEVIDKSTPVA